MLSTISSVIAFGFLVGMLQDGMPTGWTVFSSKSGRFSVALPSAPVERSQFVGQLKVVKFIAEGKNEALFVISFTDFADADVKKDALQKRLDQARDGAVASVSGMLKADKAILLEGHPGRDIVIENGGVVIVRMRIYVVDRRVYQVLALGPPPALASQEIAFFLDSFRLIK